MSWKTMSLVCAAFVIIVASTSSAFVVVEERLLIIPDQATPWNVTEEIPQFNPADHGGFDLVEVTFTLMGDAMSTVDIVSNGGPVTVLSGDVGAFITATGSIAGLALDALPKGQFAPPTIHIDAGQSANLTDVAGSDMDTMTIDTMGDLSPYIGDGSFSIEVNAMGTSSLTTSGGNWDASQRTEAGASLLVTYAIVPEPETMAWMALAACVLLVRFRTREIR